MIKSERTMNQEEITDQIKKGTPFEGLTDIRLLEVQEEAPIANLLDQSARPDLVLTLDFGGKLLKVYGEIKSQITPKVLRQFGPWLARLKALSPKELYALICPFLSPQSQRYCMENKIDFIDLSGNVLLRVPGKVLIQRLGRPNKYRGRQLFRNPFAGASSRVVRVLLQFPNQAWTVTGIEKELAQESEQQDREGMFELSISSISKTLQSLEEELLIRRDKSKIIVPEPRRVLIRWAEKYQERYKWTLRRSWTVRNPFGFDVESSVKGLTSRFRELDSVLTGTAAANISAPFLNSDRIDVFLLRNQSETLLRALNNERSLGPDFLFIYPYDIGVAMYAGEIEELRVTSPVQTYLDCYARGGRDAKQAERLLSDVIEKKWNEV